MYLDIRGKSNIRKIGAVLAFVFQALQLDRFMRRWPSRSA